MVEATLGHPVDQLRMRATFRIFGAAVALLVLIVCANVANLLLSRAASRRREMGIRQSLGADRRRLVRQLLTESLLLGIAGGFGGLLLALAARSLMGFYFGAEIVEEMRFDYRVLGLTTLASLGVTLFFGLAPALVTSRIHLVAALKDATADGGRRRFAAGPLLAVAQVGLALVLLAASGLLVGNLRDFENADLGFDAGNLLMARLDLGRARYSHEASGQLFRQLRERAAAIPGVESAAVTFLVPPVFLDISIPLRLPEDPETVQTSRMNFTDAEFFATLGLPLLRGRLFEPQDAESGRGVVVVNRELAEKLWPDGSPVGRVVRLERARPTDPGTDYEVVGVVDSVSQFTWNRSPELYGVGASHLNKDDTEALNLRSDFRFNFLNLSLVGAGLPGATPGEAENRWGGWQHQLPGADREGDHPAAGSTRPALSATGAGRRARRRGRRSTGCHMKRGSEPQQRGEVLAVDILHRQEVEPVARSRASNLRRRRHGSVFRRNGFRFYNPHP